MKKESEGKKPRLKINVCTVPNGYSLTVGTNHYLYFTVEELVAGFIYHVGLGENNFVSNEFISAIVEAAADWKSGGDFVKKEAAKVISIEARVNDMKRQCKLLTVENRNLKKLLQMKGVNVVDD